MYKYRCEYVTGEPLSVVCWLKWSTNVSGTNTEQTEFLGEELLLEWGRRISAQPQKSNQRKRQVHFWEEKQWRMHKGVKRLRQSKRNTRLPKNTDEYLADRLKVLERKQKFYLDKPSPDVAELLQAVGATYVKKGNQKAALEYLQKACDMKLQLGVKPKKDMGKLLYSVGTLLTEQGKPATATNYFSQALAIQKKVHKRAHPQLGRTLYNLGSAYFNAGQNDKALEFLKKALEIKEKVYPNLKHPSIPRTLNLLGLVHTMPAQENNASPTSTENASPHSTQSQDTALEYLHRAVQAHQKLEKRNYSEIAKTWYNIGILYKKKLQNDKALEALQQALSSVEGAADLTSNQSFLRDLWTAIGDIHVEMGSWTLALEFYTKALEKQQKSSENDNIVLSSTAGLMNRIANVYSKQSEWEKSLEYHSRALEIRKKIHSGPHKDIVESLRNIGVVYLKQSNVEMAKKYHSECYEMLLEMAQECPHELAWTLDGLAKISILENQRFEAYYYLLQVLYLKKELFGCSKDVLDTWIELGANAYKVHSFASATQFYLEAVKVAKTIGTEPNLIAIILENIACCHNALGDTQKAIDYLLESFSVRSSQSDIVNFHMVSICFQVGQLYYGLQAFYSALDYLKQSLDLYSKLPESSKDMTFLAELLYTLGATYYCINDLEKSLQNHVKALETRIAVYEHTAGTAHTEEQHSQVVASLNFIKALCSQIGDKEKAMYYDLLAHSWNNKPHAI